MEIKFVSILFLISIVIFDLKTIVFYIFIKMFLNFLIVSTLGLIIKSSEERSFLHWMRESKNFYIGEEYHFRLGVWIANYRYIQSQNTDFSKKHFKCGMNSLSALTSSEYRSYLGYRLNKDNSKNGKTIMTNSKSNYNKIQSSYAKNKDYPDELDYRTNEPAVLNPISNVGSCAGADWAFSVTSSIETNHAIKEAELIKLSEQCLIDCVTYCDGCNSCTPYKAFFCITNERYQCHVNTESDYPYEGSKGECRFNMNKALALYSGVIWQNDQPENDMIGYLNDYGIGALSMDATAASFQLYVSGIYDDKNCGTENNHAINVVGYGTEGEGDSAIPYWICRNCWGRAWGEDGYFRIIRGVNQCGISKQVGFPLKFF